MQLVGCDHFSPSILDANRNETATFRPGDVVYIERTLRTHRHVIYNQAWRLLVSTNDNTIIAREEVFPLPFPIGETTRTVSFHIPADAREGPYMIQTFVNYKLNPLRDVLFEFDRYYIEVEK